MVGYLDTNNCEDHFHIFKRNEDGQMEVLHADGKVCEDSEFLIKNGGEEELSREKRHDNAEAIHSGS